jgi:hypothetical protein
MKKTCRDCHEIKPSDAFYRDRKAADGLRPRCKVCSKAARRAWAVRNPAKVADYNRAYNVQQKASLVQAFGGFCACCGEDELTFLTIDHIGQEVPGEHFRADGKRLAGRSLYELIHAEGCPRDKYRVLCWNCNAATAHGRPCPHELAREAVA